MYSVCLSSVGFVYDTVQIIIQIREAKKKKPSGLEASKSKAVENDEIQPAASINSQNLPENITRITKSIN